MSPLTVFGKRFIICLLLWSTICVNATAISQAEQVNNTNREKFIKVFNKSHEGFRDEKALEVYKSTTLDKDEHFLSISKHINLGKHYAAAEGSENPISNDYFNKAVEETRRVNDKEILLFALTQRGFYYYRMRKISMAMPDFLETLFILERNPTLTPPFPEEVYKQIGFFMGSIGDYQKGSEFLLKSLSLSTNDSERATLNDNLGFHAIKSGNVELATQYFDKAWDLAIASKDEVRQAKVLGNRALIEKHKGRKQAAIDLLVEDIRISNANGAELNTLYATNLLAGLLIEQQKFKEAKTYLLAIKKFADAHKNLIVHREELNQHLLDIAVYEQNEKAEIGFRRLLANMQDSLNLFDGENINKQVKWLADKEVINENLRLASLKYKREKKLYLYSIIGLVIILALGLYFSLKYLSKRRKLESRYYQDSLSKIEQERHLLDKELTFSQETLHKKIETLEEKNRRIESLLQSLKEGLPNDVFTVSGLNTHNVGNSHLLTDENWNQFKLSFAAEYPVCYNHIQEYYTEFSESNLRVALLWKLRLNTKEIGQVLGVGLEAVKKSKQRLRKKMGEVRYHELVEFMEAVELE